MGREPHAGSDAADGTTTDLERPTKSGRSWFPTHCAWGRLSPRCRADSQLLALLPSRGKAPNRALIIGRTSFPNGLIVRRHTRALRQAQPLFSGLTPSYAALYRVNSFIVHKNLVGPRY